LFISVSIVDNIKHPQPFSAASRIHLSTKVSHSQSRLKSSCLNSVSDRLGVACDLMALFYIFDEYTDKVDGNGALALAEVVVDALRNPHSERPHGESKLGKVTQQ
jgi:hypothetical protein